MFSILIPVKNYLVQPLVNGLLADSKQAGIPIEIIISEDGSNSSFIEQNKTLVQAEQVKQLVFNESRGRSANRNGLAKEAAFNWLIYIDSDSEIAPGFLSAYAKKLKSNTVLVGGTSYKKEQFNSSFSLRLTFGVNREMVAASVRNNRPYTAFTANNFCIQKSVFLKIQFDSSIKHYGHEDTLFGLALRKADVRVQHIHNPVVHVGLEDNITFLEKTKTGVETLVSLYQARKLAKSDVRLLQAYFKWSKYGLKLLLNLFGGRIKHVIEPNLLSLKPRLFYLDLYKLIILNSALKRAVNTA